MAVSRNYSVFRYKYLLAIQSPAKPVVAGCQARGDEVAACQP
jgi:hypothetical protein